MIKRRILYLLILAAAFWIMLMYNDIYMEGIFAVVVLVPLICIIIKHVTIFFVDVAWKSDLVITEEDSPINIMAVIRNRFFLPVNSAIITFETEDIAGNKTEYKIATNLMPRMIRYSTIELCPNYSGIITVRLKSVKINDIFGLTKSVKKIGSLLKITVYPKPCKCMPITVESIALYKEGSDDFSDVISGNDKSQIFDISSYNTGDSIRDIHWKLSTKTDELMVKRYSFPMEKQVNVFIDYGKPEKKDITAAGAGQFFKRTFAIISELEKSQENISIYAFTGNGEGCVRINKEDILYLDINACGYPEEICQSFMKTIGMGNNILITSRMKKEELCKYGCPSDFYVDWRDLYSEKSDELSELFIQEAKVIGIHMEDCDDKRPAVSMGDELFINKDNMEIEIYTYIFRILLILAGSIIPPIIFYDVLSLYEGTPVKVIIYAALALVLMLISTAIKKFKAKLIYMLAAIVSVIFLMGINNIADGVSNTIRAFGNTMMFYGKSYGLTMDNHYELINFTALAAFIYGILLFIFTWRSISITIHLILSLPPFILCLAYGCVPKGVYTIIYVSYITAVIVYGITYRNIIKAEKGIEKKSFYESTINIGAVLSYTVIALTAVVMIINTIKGYHRPVLFNDIKAEVNAFIEDFTFKGNKISNTAKGGINNGKLGAVDSIKYSGETVLTVKVSGELTFPIYLRGYTGTSYTGSSWDEISENENREIEYMLGSEHITLHEAYNLPYYILRDESMDISAAGHGMVKSGRVYVENMNGNDGTYYIPYGAYAAPDLIVNRDGMVMNNAYGTNSYSVYQLKGIDSFSQYIAANEYGDNTSEDYDYTWDDYARDERVYRELAYNYYADYDGDEAVRERLINEMPWQYTVDGITYNLHDGPKVIGYEPYMQAVQNYLERNYEYSLSPGKLDDGEDFIESFMDEKIGYCTYFATIATEMFRIYGIPARYVEGFYVKPSAIDLIEYYKNNNIIINVTDDKAHAWTEIYIDGLGFIPVETTPGYAGVNYNYEEETSNEEPTTNAGEGNTDRRDNREDETTTSPKEAAEEENSTSADDGTQDTGGVRLFGFLKNKYIQAVLLIIVILTVILGRKSRHDSKNDKIVRKGKCDDEAVMWEEQLEKMTECIKPQLNLPKEAPRNELADIIVQYINAKATGKKLNKKDVEDMFLIFDKAAYSKMGADRSEMKAAADTAAAIMEELYKSQFIIRRLFIKYIKCLYLK